MEQIRGFNFFQTVRFFVKFLAHILNLFSVFYTKCFIQPFTIYIKYRYTATQTVVYLIM